MLPGTTEILFIGVQPDRQVSWQNPKLEENPLQPTKYRPEHILIVEDEGLIAADVQKRLQRLGYPLPVIASSGVEALRCAKSNQFDLVLMDIRLKGKMDGIATARALKTEFETSVVYMTAHADQETVDRAKLTEPLGFLLKPISDGDLRSVLELSLYRQCMERKVRVREGWLATTLCSVGDGVIAANTEGAIMFLNPIAQKLTGWPIREAIGHALEKVLVLSEEPGAPPYEGGITDLPTGECRNYQVVSRKGAATPVEVLRFANRSLASSVPVPPAGALRVSNPDPIEGLDEKSGCEDDLLGFIVVLRDITARRQLEERLMRSQKMEAVANLAGGLAHDFNNQLTIILGYSEVFVKKADGELREAALAVKQAALVASSITGQLLTLSRRDSIQREPFNVNEMIRELEPTISHTLGKTRTLLTHLDPLDGVVNADRNQLKQVLLNLALNARDAMPRGGELRIGSFIVEIDAKSAERSRYAPGRYVRLRVTDTGEGMDKSTLSRIFEPFFTTKKPGFGTGLGLSVAHSIITQSGGYISAESELGRGTRFEILLPCARTIQKGTAADGSGRSLPVDSTPTVRLVELDRHTKARQFIVSTWTAGTAMCRRAGRGPEIL